ncbi:Terpene synthase metal-binding domain-containing protein-like protein [Leptotrombidium deliense]|uniref:Terpene synthase n=1 Tax=Leptotrombidium deliense TaxID=299467 RepID=A0A443S3X6_9ACAR|nr:Terpene synthase metal-binding domain-containing protein-like protein [Leptotrombidium deliense]
MFNNSARLREAFSCFPFQCNPEKNAIEKLTNDWLQKYIVDQKMFKKFVQSRVSLISAFFFPFAPINKCVNSNKLMILLTIADDFKEDRNQESEAKALIQRFMDIIENDEKVNFSPECWFEAAVSIAWQDILNDTPIGWQRAFKSALATIMKSFIEETKFTTNVPTVEEYFALRLISIAFNFVQLLIEYCCDKYLSYFERGNIAIQSLLTTVNYNAVVLNDLFSFKKEENNELNLIRVYMKHENLDEDEAEIKAIEFLEQNIRFYSKQRQLLCVYPDSTKWYLNYVDQIIRGTYDFYTAVPRYSLR